jgi:hypothetical protein
MKLKIIQGEYVKKYKCDKCGHRLHKVGWKSLGNKTHYHKICAGFMISRYPYIEIDEEDDETFKYKKYFRYAWTHGDVRDLVKQVNGETRTIYSLDCVDCGGGVIRNYNMSKPVCDYCKKYNKNKKEQERYHENKSPA